MTVAYQPNHDARAAAPLPARASAAHLPPMPYELAWGEQFSDGLAGVRSNGEGGILFDEPARDASKARMWDLVNDATSGIPAATATGDLPTGIHRAGWTEVVGRYAHGERRVDLATQLERALGAMHAAGVEQAVIGGSFIGTKAEPGDVDVAVVPRGDSSSLDVHRLQKRVNRAGARDVHLYPAQNMVSNSGYLPGSRAGENFLELFLHDRTGAERGAILVQPTDVPIPPKVSLFSRLAGVFR